VSEYNRDQVTALRMVRRFLREAPGPEKDRMSRMIHEYLEFRKEVASFQERFFSELCTEKCFTSHTSACCGREGIATFFADVLVNALISAEKELDALLQILSRDQGGAKCVYLTNHGCAWRLKPIVCEMFLCQHAKDTVLGADETLAAQWERLRKREKQFTWPDRPVLFDVLEKILIDKGYDSPLMYCHKSPGLLRLKARSKIGESPPALK
jgi:hypothetical protein